jgi:hypothetical protein
VLRSGSVSDQYDYIVITDQLRPARGVLNSTQRVKAARGWALEWKGKAKNCQTLSGIYALRIILILS